MMDKDIPKSGILKYFYFYSLMAFYLLLILADKESHDTNQMNPEFVALG